MSRLRLTDANRKAVLADLRKCPELHAQGKLQEARDLAENIAALHAFQRSVDAVKSLVSTMNQLLGR